MRARVRVRARARACRPTHSGPAHASSQVPPAGPGGRVSPPPGSAPRACGARRAPRSARTPASLRRAPPRRELPPRARHRPGQHPRHAGHGAGRLRVTQGRLAVAGTFLFGCGVTDRAGCQQLLSDTAASPESMIISRCHQPGSTVLTGSRPYLTISCRMVVCRCRHMFPRSTMHVTGIDLIG